MPDRATLDVQSIYAAPGTDINAAPLIFSDRSRLIARQRGRSADGSSIRTTPPSAVATQSRRAWSI
jgi:hypothetical protein